MAVKDEDRAQAVKVMTEVLADNSAGQLTQEEAAKAAEKLVDEATQRRADTEDS
jgi:hypothetical protein